MTAPDSQIDPKRSFATWTDEELRQLAEKYSSLGPVDIDWTRDIIREGDDLVFVPALVELCHEGCSPDELLGEDEEAVK